MPSDAPASKDDAVNKVPRKVRDIPLALLFNSADLVVDQLYQPHPASSRCFTLALEVVTASRQAVKFRPFKNVRVHLQSTFRKTQEPQMFNQPQIYATEIKTK
jgi:hypothetical protein